jgi:hypothetical protein
VVVGEVLVFSGKKIPVHGYNGHVISQLELGMGLTLKRVIAILKTLIGQYH